MLFHQAEKYKFRISKTLPLCPSVFIAYSFVLTSHTYFSITRGYHSRNCSNIDGSFQSFFTRENQSTPWKRVFTVFLVFSRVSLKIPRVVQSFYGYFFRFFQGLELNFHGQKSSIISGKITVFPWKAIYVGKRCMRALCFCNKN